MDKIYVLAKWIYGDHLPYYELVSIHTSKDAAMSQYKEFIKGIDKVKEYRSLPESEDMIAGANYIENGGAIFVNDLIVYEVEPDKQIKLTNKISVNQ